RSLARDDSCGETARGCSRNSQSRRLIRDDRCWGRVRERIRIFPASRRRRLGWTRRSRRWRLGWTRRSRLCTGLEEAEFEDISTEQLRVHRRGAAAATPENRMIASKTREHREGRKHRESRRTRGTPAQHHATGVTRPKTHTKNLHRGRSQSAETQNEAPR
ncbi:unnamed protein product, partial [Pylaiella littoralis]